MTPGQAPIQKPFFEEEEAADMPYSAYSVDGGVRGYGCVHQQNLIFTRRQA